MSNAIFKLRLRTEILYKLVIIMISSMLLISLMVLKFSRDFMVEKLKQEHIHDTWNIQQSFKSLLEHDNDYQVITDLFRYLNDLERLGKGLKIIVFDVSGDNANQIFGRNSSSLIIDDKLKEKVRKSMASDKVSPLLHYSKLIGFIGKFEGIETFIPLYARGGKKYVVYLTGGEVFGESSFKNIKIMTIIYTGIFALVMVIFGYVLLSNSVIKPLEKISSVAADIASGNLKADIELNLQNEIGDLARSIRKMMEKLLNSQMELKDNLLAVEKLNKALSEAQMEIVRAEKLASIGRLSSGIAHEIGNPLSAVLGYIEILKDESKNKEETDLLFRAEVELQRISRIIKQLLDFSRPSSLELRESNLNECIKETLANLEVQGILKGIEVDFRPLKDIEKVVMDEGQVRQILLNLLKNSADAVNERYKHKKKGKIIINLSLSTVKELEELGSTFLFGFDTRKDDPPGKFFLTERLKRRRSDPPESEFFTKRGRNRFEYPKFLYNEDEELVKLTVEDNGIGIKKEDIHKIFDPFYTTKDPGKGTGLGLYMTLNIVDAMGGHVDLISEYGKGTLFLVLLPKTLCFRQ